MLPASLFVHKQIWKLLPWRVRRQAERAILASTRFLPATDTLQVTNGEPSASLIAVGDLAPLNEIEKSFRRGGAIAVAGDLFQTLMAADLRIGNFETQFTGRDAVKGRLRASPEMAGLLTGLRFDAVTVANNHALDYGEEGLLDSLRVLDAHGIKHCGGGESAEAARAPALMRANGLSIGMLGYCDDYVMTNGAACLAPTRDDAILEDIRLLRTQVDFVIVQLHWGYEFALHPFFSHRERARRFAEAGADLVLCHHAHVPMGLETWQGALIAYGLGNFLFYRSSYLVTNHPWTYRSFALEVHFSKAGAHRARLIPSGIGEDGALYALRGSARSELLGAVTAMSRRLQDAGFLAAIERDRTIREGLQMVENLRLGASDGSGLDRMWALQLGAPRQMEMIQALKDAESSRPVGEFLEAAAQAGGLNGVRLSQAAQDAITRLEAEENLPHGDLPGRTPYT